MSGKTRTKIGYINFQKSEKGFMKKWRNYKFNLTKMYFLYFKTDNAQKPDGQILLSSITRLETDTTKEASYPLQVHFKGRAEHGPGSPWVLNLTSNEERMEWMEALIPGSSEYLQRFSRSGSHHGAHTNSQSSMQRENPYSLAGPDSNGTHVDVESSWHNSVQHPSPNSVQPQPLNYMEPVPYASLSQHSNHHLPANRTQSESTIDTSPDDISENLTKSADGRLSHGLKNRQASNRSTFAYSERQHHQAAGLSRSHTERTPSRSPEDRVQSGGVDASHIYELEFDGSDSNRPPVPSVPPPRARPRPAPRPVAGQSPAMASQGYSGVSAAAISKQPEFQEREKPYLDKPPIAPRKPRRADRPQKQPDYLALVEGNVAKPDTQTRDGTQDNVVAGISEQMIQNFTPDQLGMLMTMLQQVQCGGKPAEQQAVKGVAPGQKQGADASNLSGSLIKRNFQRAVSYTPQLETDKILVTEEDDSEGYESRPDWAKAVSMRHSTADPHDPDTLSDLQEDALYIPRTRLADFTVIGEGQFGKVFRATMQRGSEPISVAVKTAKKSTSAKEQKEFRREMNIMSQMVHPNIVQLYGIIKDDVPAPWIVLEYLSNGDIKNFLMENKRPIEQLVKYMIDVSMGMHYLSERGLIHRDLAARNVLVGENETCKVSDFGLLRELPKDDSIYHMQTNVPCPVRWMPPESISDRAFSPASDVWSFGVLQWEMFNPHKTPYEHLGNLEVAMKVMKGYRLEVPPSCPHIIGRIMKACWHQKPEKRPSFLLISTLLTTKVTFTSEDS